MQYFPSACVTHFLLRRLAAEVQSTPAVKRTTLVVRGDQVCLGLIEPTIPLLCVCHTPSPSHSQVRSDVSLLLPTTAARVIAFLPLSRPVRGVVCLCVCCRCIILVGLCPACICECVLAAAVQVLCSGSSGPGVAAYMLDPRCVSSPQGVIVRYQSWAENCGWCAVTAHSGCECPARLAKQIVCLGAVAAHGRLREAVNLVFAALRCLEG